jgi:hypothetical protein
MIVKTPKGYEVKSETGKKNLSKDNLTKLEALKRLKQVEWFKHNPQK